MNHSEIVSFIWGIADLMLDTPAFAGACFAKIPRLAARNHSVLTDL